MKRTFIPTKAAADGGDSSEKKYQKSKHNKFDYLLSMTILAVVLELGGT